MKRLHAFHRSDEGQNLVEFALLLPILMHFLNPFLPDEPGTVSPWIRLPGRIAVVIN